MSVFQDFLHGIKPDFGYQKQIINSSFFLH